QELGPAPLSPERDPAAVSPRAVRATAADSGRPGTCLPSRWSLFVGREGERIRLAKLLRPGQARLVTLTGPGGSGKTRLALEAARSMVSAYDSAVWFVPLADLADPRSIPQRICQSLGLALSPGEDALARVAQALGGEAGEPGLLVLDNLEHLIGEGGAILVGLLERLPQLTCLVTSRIRLNLAGEREFPIPPLAVPEPGADLETLLACDSVCLFVDRAQSVRPGFEVTERNAAAVLALCQRLDGIPLALELAAARAQVLTPAQMVEQLVHGSDFLVSHRRDAEARHRSLQAAVEWSFQLLEPEVQRYFVAFSIFRGGWSLEAASAVTVPVLMPESAGEADAPQVRARVLEALSRLCECSLVVADELDGKMRYRMLETLREYAQARLTAEERVQLHRAHLSWCQSVVDQVGMVSRGDSESGGMELIDPESENLWAALDWCRGPAGDVEAGIRLAACLGVYWYTRGDILRARECLLSLLARPETAAPTVWRAAALNAAGVMLTCQGDDQEAVPRFEEALELGRQLGHRGVTTHALSRLARISHRRGEFDRARA
ncbi:MAG: tetratricopeptide repeat protein, partial [Armatimonadetes bacterium]|nr:tetratricopeptide repeat protein [Armatimonadota bacterium]